jgi:hypothetical protein
MSNREMPPLPSPEKSGEAVEAKVIKSDKIEVVALAKGFYGQRRRSPGDKFMINSFADLGSWMKCTDKAMQKKHEEAMKEKKAVKPKIAGR